MSFTHVGVTKFMVAGLVTSSIAASLFEVKHYLYVLFDPHIWRYHQFWRFGVYQLSYNNSTEVMFACMAIYNMRIIERIWGSRKYASFLLITSMFTAIIPPFIIAAVLRPLTGGAFNYLPAGPTAVIFAVLAQYYNTVPHIYQFQVTSAKPNSSTQGDNSGITLSDKWYRYLIAIQLAAMQMPGSLVSAAVGWIIGYTWKDIMPACIVKWRVPAWVVGQSADQRGAEFEGLRRRLEGEHTARGDATGAQNGEARPEGIRQRLMDNMGINI